ncbi:hypothetical protein H7F20_01315 [Robiginitalea sp. SC105]|nr:hypothetical protein [Robiginitalea sp. SC105]
MLLAGCKGEKKQETDTGSDRMAEVVAIHDEAMNEMKTISKLVAELKPIADSTGAGSPYQKAMTDLQDAYQSMMDWMRGFGDRFDHEEVMKGKALSPEKKEWLEEEMVKVQAMRDKVLGSIERAREVLENRPEE